MFSGPSHPAGASLRGASQGKEGHPPPGNILHLSLARRPRSDTAWEYKGLFPMMPWADLHTPVRPRPPHPETAASPLPRWSLRARLVLAPGAILVLIPLGLRAPGVFSPRVRHGAVPLRPSPGAAPGLPDRQGLILRLKVGPFPAPMADSLHFRDGPVISTLHTFPTPWVSSPL